MATPLEFNKTQTMSDGTAKSYQAQKYYAGGGYEPVWPVSMVGGETTSGSKAFLLPWVSVAGVYVDPRGPILVGIVVWYVEGISKPPAPATRRRRRSQQPRQSYISSTISEVPSNGVLAEKGREGKGSAVGSGASVRRRLSTTSSGSLVALLEENDSVHFLHQAQK